MKQKSAEMPSNKKGKVPRQGNILFMMETPNTLKNTTPKTPKRKVRDVKEPDGSLNFNEFETTLNRAA